MNEVADGDGFLDSLLKDSDLVARTRVANMHHAYAAFDDLGIRHRAAKLAEVLDDKAYNRAVSDIDDAFFNQIISNGRIYPAVVNRVVNVSVDIVVGPAGGNRCEVSKTASGFGLGRERLLAHE